MNRSAPGRTSGEEREEEGGFWEGSERYYTEWETLLTCKFGGCIIIRSKKHLQLPGPGWHWHDAIYNAIERKQDGASDYLISLVIPVT